MRAIKATPMCVHSGCNYAACIGVFPLLNDLNACSLACIQQQGGGRGGKGGHWGWWWWDLEFK